MIEFQHSKIESAERSSREKFYKNMVWVVDGTRLKRDYPRFLKGKSNFQNTDLKGIFLMDDPDECLPSTWLESSVPVIFDFLGTDSIENTNDLRNNLYCLFPMQIGRHFILAEIPRKTFIKTTMSGEWVQRAKNFMEKISLLEQERQSQLAEQQRKNKITMRKRASTHYYDPRKGRFVKKWRF